MIVSKLYGGLGNQMFQYCAARSLAKANEIVYFDTTFYDENATDTDYFIARDYELGIFPNLKSHKASGLQRSVFTSQSFVFKAIRAVLGARLQCLHHPGTSYISFATHIKSRHVYLDGYFQSEKYFAHKRDVILNEFQFPSLDDENQQIASKIKNAPNAVSLHVRRGDYLIPNINDIHGTLPLSYYHKALAALRARYNDLIIFVFSDDISWVKENLHTGGVETIFVENNHGANCWKDMALMTFCKHHIVANSSFSWWGAWLSTRGGEAFAPCNWFVPPFKFDITDIVPHRWTVLQYE